MKYKELGKTGMKISQLGFGASSLGGVFHDIDLDKAKKAVFAAIGGGINFIDVSPYYGYFKAEAVLGMALKEIPRNKFFLSTKVGRYGSNGVNSWDYSPERVTSSVYESMERLNIDYIDIINVHDIEFASNGQGIPEGVPSSGLAYIVDVTLPALLKLKKEGVVRHIGITDLQLENLKWVIDHSEPGTVESVLNFCHFCLNDDKLNDYLGYFEQKGVGVINASPFAMGLLTERGIPDWHPAPRPLVEVCTKAAAFCKSKGVSIEKLATQYSVSNPRIACTLFSSANPDNVKKNIESINQPLDWDMVFAIDQIIGNQKRVSWSNT